MPPSPFAHRPFNSNDGFRRIGTTNPTPEHDTPPGPACHVSCCGPGFPLLCLNDRTSKPGGTSRGRGKTERFERPREPARIGATAKVTKGPGGADGHSGRGTRRTERGGRESKRGIQRKQIRVLAASTCSSGALNLPLVDLPPGGGGGSKVGYE